MTAFAAFPYDLGLNGLTEQAASADHVVQLIAQVLFVDPGERVNRPQFGTPLRQLVFADGSTATAALVEAQVHAALRQWLGDLIQLQAVDVTMDPPRVSVVVRYVDVRTQQIRQVHLET